jgi:hypothetical protein
MMLCSVSLSFLRGARVISRKHREPVKRHGVCSGDFFAFYVCDAGFGNELLSWTC